MGASIVDIASDIKFEDAIAIITKEYQKKSIQLTYLQQVNEKLQTELYKDEELQKLKTRNEELEAILKKSFVLTDEEVILVEKWKEKHLREKHWDKEQNMPIQSGAISDRFSYEFIPTSFGTIGIVKCACGDNYWFRGANNEALN